MVSERERERKKCSLNLTGCEEVWRGVLRLACLRGDELRESDLRVIGTVRMRLLVEDEEETMLK